MGEGTNERGWQLHVFDIKDPDTEIEARTLFQVQATLAGDIITPQGCVIIGFQWAPPQDKEDDNHLYVFVERKHVVAGFFPWPEGIDPSSWD